MSIYQYPNYLEFIKNERKTLQFLSSAGFIEKQFSPLAESAKVTLYNLPSTDQKLRNAEFLFGSNFDIFIENNVRRIVIEAQVLPNFNMVSYVLSICENSEQPFCLIRKFHFDYAIPIPNQDPKPVYHIQYGGELSPQLELLEIAVTELHPWLSTPRITFYPINLALLLDMVFSEFVSEETAGIVNRSEWRDFIKGNEKAILEPFYKGVAHFFNADHKSNYLLRDFCYGIKNQ